MTAAQIIDKYFPRSKEDCYLKTVYEKETIEMLEEYARIKSIEFFKWYAIKITGLIEYIQDIRPRVRSEEVEAKIVEFEGQPLEKLYELFQKSSLK